MYKTNSDAFIRVTPRTAAVNQPCKLSIDRREKREQQYITQYKHQKLFKVR